MLDTQKHGLQVVVHWLERVLGTELGSLGRAANSLTIEQPLQLLKEKKTQTQISSYILEHAELKALEPVSEVKMVDRAVV